MNEWIYFKTTKPNPGTKLIAYDGRSWGVYTTMKPSKDSTMEDCLDHLNTMIDVYGLIAWYVPKLPEE